MGTKPRRAQTNPQVVAGQGKGGQEREGCTTSGDTGSSPRALADWLTADAATLDTRESRGSRHPCPMRPLTHPCR